MFVVFIVVFIYRNVYNETCGFVKLRTFVFNLSAYTPRMFESRTF